MEERGIARRQQRQPPAIAFLDLTGYTELAEERGDEAAAEIATCLADIVHRGLGGPRRASGQSGSATASCSTSATRRAPW
jgi:hypothetical protein